MILIGFYLVSRPRATSNAGPHVLSSHQHSPIAHSPPPGSEPDTRERWKIWQRWRHTNCADPTTPNTPTSQPSPAPAPISKPSHVARIKRGLSRTKTHPPIAVRPSHSRRPTNLSVATSFPHSHITEEALSDFRASAYDLDVDLEAEMLHSARDDVWLGHHLQAVEGGCSSMSVEAVMEAQGNAMPTVEGSVEGDAPTRPAIQWGADYENLGACQVLASASKPESVVIEVVAAREVFQ